jgi:hypothetical protein
MHPIAQVFNAPGEPVDGEQVPSLITRVGPERAVWFLTGEPMKETITKWGLRRLLRRLFAGLHARIPPTKQVPEFVV